MRGCYPATAASEVVSGSSWWALRLMSAEQTAGLRARFASEVEALNFQACRRIADDLRLSYTQARPLLCYMSLDPCMRRGLRPCMQVFLLSHDDLRLSYTQARPLLC
jgi:hypothetical protein